MTRLKFTVITLCVPALISLAGCGSNQSQDQSAASGENAKNNTPQVALIMKSLANEFFSTMADGAKSHQQTHADEYELIVNGIKDERDLGQQVSLVEAMIARRVDAIVIAPADSKALVPVCKRAQDAGIVVVNIDNKLDDEVLSEARATIPFVGPDNRLGAKIVGEYLASQITAGDLVTGDLVTGDLVTGDLVTGDLVTGNLVTGNKVAILEGVRTAFNAQQRRLGFEDAMKAANIEVVDSQSAQWEMGQANTVASAMLGEHPEIKGLLCSNDSMALGALAAVKAAGREADVKIVGFDNISAVRQAIREGSILATADQHGDHLAVYGIELALQIVAGEATPADKQTPVDLITSETLE